MALSPTSSHGGGSSAPDTGLRTVTFSRTSAQLLALFSAPATVVAAPGAGLAVVPVAANLVFHAGATPYADGGNHLAFGPAPLDGLTWFRLPGAGSMLASATDQFVFDSLASGPMDKSAYANLALVFGTDTANFTAGNGTLTGQLLYYVATA